MPTPDPRPADLTAQDSWEKLAHDVVAWVEGLTGFAVDFRIESEAVRAFRVRRAALAAPSRGQGAAEWCAELKRLCEVLHDRGDMVAQSLSTAAGQVIVTALIAEKFQEARSPAPVSRPEPEAERPRPALPEGACPGCGGLASCWCPLPPDVLAGRPEPRTGGATPEAVARRLLADCGVEDAESLTAGDVIGIANLVAENQRLRRRAEEAEERARAAVTLAGELRKLVKKAYHDGFEDARMNPEVTVIEALYDRSATKRRLAAFKKGDQDAT